METERDPVVTLEAWARAIRKTILQMTAEAGHGHPGGSLSAVEILTVLYFHILCIDPVNPNWPDRDRFILSKGHGASAWYATLGLRGFFPAEMFHGFRRLGGALQGHPDRCKVPGVDMSSGSLGQGLSVALGMALAARFQQRSYRVYCLLGDGEIQEGQVWEAAMAAGNYGVDNLIAILDYNRVQLDGFVHDIMPIEPLADKWHAFGWEVIDCSDGHSIPHLLRAFEKAFEVNGRPSIIVAHTVKGKGVSFMENEAAWHGVADASRLTEAIVEVSRP